MPRPLNELGAAEIRSKAAALPCSLLFGLLFVMRWSIVRCSFLILILVSYISLFGVSTKRGKDQAMSLSRQRVSLF